MNYNRIYDQIISRAKNRRTCDYDYIERHHIIPRCLGGGDERENIAILTAEEHYICHLLLARIHPDHIGLNLVVCLMARGRYLKRKRGSKAYAERRKRLYAKNKLLRVCANPTCEAMTPWAMFCSKSCHLEYKRINSKRFTVEAPCSFCGNIVTRHRGREFANVFCDRECLTQYKLSKVEKVEITRECGCCSKSITKLLCIGSDNHKRYADLDRAVFCSIACGSRYHKKIKDSKRLLLV